jgi:hypothetical protein
MGHPVDGEEHVKPARQQRGRAMVDADRVIPRNRLFNLTQKGRACLGVAVAGWSR